MGVRGLLLILGVVVGGVSCRRGDERVIGVVAGYPITQGDVDAMVALNRLQPGMDTTRRVALYQLRRTYLYLHIADSLGYPVTDSLIRWEALRIARHTLMPRRIDSIRIACGDSLRYIKYFVLPQLLPRWLQSHFVWDSGIHKSRGDTARLLIAEWRKMGKQLTVFENLSGVGLQRLARKYHYAYERYRVDSIGGIQPVTHTAPKGKSEAVPPAKIPEMVAWFSNQQMTGKADVTASQLINHVLRNMQPGQVFPYPIEHADCFWVLQLIDYFDGAYYIAIIRIPKIDFDSWLRMRGYLF